VVRGGEVVANGVAAALLILGAFTVIEAVRAAEEVVFVGSGTLAHAAQTSLTA
jgi:hypothetical protein